MSSEKKVETPYSKLRPNEDIAQPGNRESSETTRRLYKEEAEKGKEDCPPGY